MLVTIVPSFFTLLREILVPRRDVLVLPADLPADEALKKLVAEVRLRPLPAADPGPGD